jgi:hypothetical protein
MKVTVCPAKGQRCFVKQSMSVWSIEHTGGVKQEPAHMERLETRPAKGRRFFWKQGMSVLSEKHTVGEEKRIGSDEAMGGKIASGSTKMLRSKWSWKDTEKRKKESARMKRLEARVPRVALRCYGRRDQLKGSDRRQK